MRPLRPPKGGNKRKGTNTGLNSEAASAPQTPTLAESLSYLHAPRPFKNPEYTKNANRRTKNLKAVLTQERERERAERERRRALRDGGDDAMEIDVEEQRERSESMEGEGKEIRLLAAAEEANGGAADEEDVPTYSSIEAPPSIVPQRRYCDITGLEAPYTDPATGLRYHDKSIYELIKGMNTGTVKEYLAARGVNPIVK